jgi:hypothetical protein
MPPSSFAALLSSVCHDLSWPLPDNPFGVESPNEADEPVMVIVFAVLSQLCSAAAVFLAAGLPMKLVKFDLFQSLQKERHADEPYWASYDLV